jgi:hypothetical protein
MSVLPSDPIERKKYPIATGVLDYFPAALAQVAYVSYVGNQQHNPGEPLHWTRDKSVDQADTALRHFIERDFKNNDGTVTLTKDVDGTYHLAKACWRLLAALQIALEAQGAPLARNAILRPPKGV